MALFFVILLAWIGIQALFSWHCNLQGQIELPKERPQQREAVTAGITGYERPEDDTYLSYPEWYIVWSYEEKAQFQQKNLPSGFSYFGAVSQYWNSYCCISRLIHGKYKFNGGEQVMLVVIGTSYSGEYILKGAYEETIGRISEWTSGHQPVPEDDYAYKVARQYADFVYVRPFYEFHFARHVAGLWHETPLSGPHLLRKWERKLFLTLDYTIEAFYCWLIEKATHLTYGYEPANTYAWVDNADARRLQQVPHVKIIKPAGAQAYVVDIPRYQEFTSVARAFAERDIHFVEIAGNSQILISVLAPASWDSTHSGAQLLFSVPVLTHPEHARFVMNCEVSSLHAVIHELGAEHVTLEHIYDY